MGEGRHVRRIVRVQVGSAAKVGATVACAAGLIGGLTWLGYVLRTSGPPTSGDLAILAFAPVMTSAIAGIYGVVLGALCAWVFNATAWLTGGLAIEDEDGPGA